MVDIQRLLSVVATDLMRGTREQLFTAAVETGGDNTPYFLLATAAIYVATSWTIVTSIGPSLHRNEGTLESQVSGVSDHRLL